MGRVSMEYERAAELYRCGLTLAQIGDLMGVTRQAVWRALRDRGVTFRPTGCTGKRNPFYRGGGHSVRRVHSAVHRAVTSGLIQRPQTCSVCGRQYPPAGRAMIKAHHDDYSKPLDIQWMCPRCHYEWHRIHAEGGKANDGD